MAESSYNYDKYVQDALLEVVKKVLKRVSVEGLLGNHYFYINFKTQHPGAVLPEYLKEKHPDEITLVFQYQFWDLNVYDDYFSVVLSFNGEHETLKIPFAAVTSFVDPFVKFGLQFHPNMDVACHSMADGENALPRDSNVIVLDKFRKK